MAARLFQDQNLIDHVNGARTIPGKTELNGQGKTRVGGRKPLGDLSNAVKPIKQVDGKKRNLKSKNTTVTNNEAVAAKAKYIGSNKRTASKATEKSHTSGRKALSDISNSGKPRVPEITNKNSLKSSLCLSAIAEEKIFHNHQECIESQIEAEAVDMHHFFKTFGLEDDSTDHMEIPIEVPPLKYESEYLELEEVPEHLPEAPSLSEHGSPTHCNSPKYTMWNDCDVNFNFKLIETPKSSKK